eukprot:scaffold4205_cov13-Tisochrysis_lutea.AAC.1
MHARTHAPTTSVRLIRRCPSSSSCPESLASPVKMVCTWAKVPTSYKWPKESCSAKPAHMDTIFRQTKYLGKGAHLFTSGKRILKEALQIKRIDIETNAVQNLHT